MKTQPYLKLERRILNDEKGGVLHRWHFGRQLLEERVEVDSRGRAMAGKKLPKGHLERVIKAAERAGLKLSEQEIQRRIRLAEAYDSETKLRHAVTEFGSWRELVLAAFPPVEVDEVDPEEIQEQGLGDAPDSWEQMQLEIPGLKEEIPGVAGRRVKLVRGEEGGTVADVAAYLEMCEQMHENFGKTVEQIRESLRTMREGADGDDDANAVEAWEAATQDEAEDDEPGEETP